MLPHLELNANVNMLTITMLILSKFNVSVKSADYSQWVSGWHSAWVRLPDMQVYISLIET